MKNIRCMFGRHKFTDWIKVGTYLERECHRCGKVEAKYPTPIVMMIDLIGKIWLRQLDIQHPHARPAFKEVNWTERGL